MNKTLVDENLNISHVWDYQLRNVYHVSMTILTDPSLLTDEGLKDLGQDPCFAADYFYMITGTYKFLPKPAYCPIDPNDPNYNPDDHDRLTPDDIKDIIKEVDKWKDLAAAPPYYRMYTVGQYTIRTKRK